MCYKDLLALPTFRLMAIDSEGSKCLRQLRSEHEPAVLLTKNPVPLRNGGHCYGHGCLQPVKMDGTTELGEEAQAGRTGSPKFPFN